MKSARIGLISDTHGLLRPEAMRALRGADHILHAGDVGRPELLDELRAIAPVTAVRGNVDREAWARALPERAELELDGVAILVVHDGKSLGGEELAGRFAVVVSGHSHQPRIEHRDGVLWVNPGSAGPRRFRLPVCVGWLTLGRGAPRARIVELQLTK